MTHTDTLIYSAGGKAFLNFTEGEGILQQSLHVIPLNKHYDKSFLLVKLAAVGSWGIHNTQNHKYRIQVQIHYTAVTTMGNFSKCHMTITNKEECARQNYALVYSLHTSRSSRNISQCNDDDDDDDNNNNNNNNNNNVLNNPRF